MQIKFLRLPAVLGFRNCGRSSHYSDIQKGLWTTPVKISAKSVAWPEHETQAINSARLAGKSDEEIRELVSHLHALRKEAA